MSGRLVGREGELEILSRASAAAALHGLHLCVIQGEAGVGKSSLVNSYAAATGIEPSICRFGVGESGIHRVSNAFALSQPRNRTTGPGAEPDSLDRAEDVRIQRRRSIHALAARIVEQVGADLQLVICEDLHEAEVIELEVLEAALFALADRSASSAITVLTTTRPIAPSAPQAPFIDRLTRPPWAAMVDLGPLSFDEVAQLLSDEGIEADPVELTGPIYERTGGNPLHVLAIGADRKSGQTGFRRDLPQVLSEAVSAWIDTLSADDRQILGAGAMLSDRLTEAELIAVSGASEDDVKVAINAALSARVLIDREQLTFAHSLIRAELRSHVPRHRQAEISLRCAAVAGEASDTSDDARALAVGRHLRAAGSAAPDIDRYEALVQASEAAARSFLWPSAASFAEEAVSLEASIVPPQRAGPELRLLAGRACEYAYADAAAIGHFEAVLNDPTATTTQRFWAAYWKSHLQLTRGRAASAGRPDLHALVPFLKPDADATHRVLALEIFAQAAVAGSDMSEAKYMAQLAIGEAKSVDAPAVRARAEWAAGVVELQSLSPRLGQEHLALARDHADDGSDDLVSMWSHNRLAMGSWMTAELEEAVRLAQTGGERAKTYGILGEAAYSAAIEAGVAASIGDFRVATRIGKKAVRHSEVSNFTQVQYFICPTLIWTHHARGSIPDAEAELGDWVARNDRIERYFLPVLDPYSHAPRWPRDDRPADLIRLGLAVTSLEALSVGDHSALDSSAMVSAADALQPHIENGVVLLPGWPSLLLRVCAALHLQAGEVEQSLDYCESALAISRQHGLKPELVRSLLLATEASARSSRLADAQRNAAEASALAEQLGMFPAASQSRRWMTQLATQAADLNADSEELTILVTDIVGSTSLALRMGDEMYTEEMLSHIELASALTSKHGGRIIDTAGDGILASFASLRAAETTAVELLQDTSSKKHDGIRVGLAVGRPFHRGDRVYGNVVNLASRICATAEANTAFGTAEIAALSDLSYARVGFRSLNGYPYPVLVYALEP